MLYPIGWGSVGPTPNPVIGIKPSSGKWLFAPTVVYRNENHCKIDISGARAKLQTKTFLSLNYLDMILVLNLTNFPMRKL